MLATGRNDDLCTAVRFSMDTLAHKALESGQATPAFTCYDCTAALGVVAAAKTAAPCIAVHVRSSVAAGTTGSRFLAALRRLADAAGTPILIQLDHATDPHLIHAAIAVRVGSVLCRQISTQLRSQRRVPTRSGQLQVHPVLLSKLRARLWLGDEDNAHAASTELDQDRSRVVKTLPGTRAHYRSLRRRHRLTLSLHERCPEA
jgi:hypothetical protein